MKPTVGRIVHYRVPEGIPPFEGLRSNGINPGDILPAIIVRVWNPDGPYADLVNLSVFTDCGPLQSVTSVHAGSGLGQWSPPPKVDERLLSGSPIEELHAVLR